VVHKNLQETLVTFSYTGMCIGPNYVTVTASQGVIVAKDPTSWVGWGQEYRLVPLYKKFPASLVG